MSILDRDLPTEQARPIGWFVHHQGRGHAERTLDLLRAMPTSRPVVVFCAKAALFDEAPPQVEIIEIPSLFQPTGEECDMDHLPQPDTVHCAMLGWPGIREAMGRIAAWMRNVDPALMISDVSAEVAQLARLMSVPHVVSLQHGNRNDAGHRAALDGAAGILAPFHPSLSQPDWDATWLQRTHYAPGLGVRIEMPSREVARQRLGMDAAAEVFLVVSGAGGNGFRTAPLGVGARCTPTTRWIVIGAAGEDWHATTNSNLEFVGWVDNPEDYIAAADLVIASTGNTTCAMVMTAARPWIAIPEWRYFDEQIEKAKALNAAGVAHHVPHPPSSAQAWQSAIRTAQTQHRPDLQRACIDPSPATAAAVWLDQLATDLWKPRPQAVHLPQNLSPLTLTANKP